MRELLKEINDWQDEVFTKATPLSAATHLLREAKELLEDPYSAEELADVFILLAAVAHLTGIDLVYAVEMKMAINRARKWGEPDAEGVVEHIKIPIYNEENKLIGYCNAEIRPSDTEFIEYTMPAEIDEEGVFEHIVDLHHWNSTDSMYDIQKLQEYADRINQADKNANEEDYTTIYNGAGEVVGTVLNWKGLEDWEIRMRLNGELPG